MFWTALICWRLFFIFSLGDLLLGESTGNSFYVLEVPLANPNYMYVYGAKFNWTHVLIFIYIYTYIYTYNYIYVHIRIVVTQKLVVVSYRYCILLHVCCNMHFTVLHKVVKYGKYMLAI